MAKLSGGTLRMASASLAMRLAFTVYGVAQTKGSTKSFGYYAKNRQTGALLLNKHGKPIIQTATTNDNAKNKGWQQLVAEGANAAIAELPASARGVIHAAVRLTVAFYLPRPVSAPARVTMPTKKPDLDKLVRSVKDALTHVVWQDDSQVVDVVAMKRYAVGVAPHVKIWVEPSTGIAELGRAQPLFDGLDAIG